MKKRMEKRWINLFYFLEFFLVSYESARRDIQWSLKFDSFKRHLPSEWGFVCQNAGKGMHLLFNNDNLMQNQIIVYWFSSSLAIVVASSSRYNSNPHNSYKKCVRGDTGFFVVRSSPMNTISLRTVQWNHKTAPKSLMRLLPSTKSTFCNVEETVQWAGV